MYTCCTFSCLTQSLFERSCCCMMFTNFGASSLSDFGGGCTSSGSGSDSTILVVGVLPGKGSFLSSFANELGVAFLFAVFTSALALTCSNACPKYDPKQFASSDFSSHC